jgi:exopolysaccharide production protein ExoZ
VAADRRNPGELAGVQILRAVAACAVVIHHALEESNGAVGRFSPDWLTTAGAAGVDIFFVISGFIMAYVTFRPSVPPPGPGRFLLRRAVRILPLYWLCCAAMLAASFAGLMRTHHWNAGEIVDALLLVPNGRLVINVSWTLSYEILFYLCFGAALVLRTLRGTILATAAAILVLMALGSAAPESRAGAFLGDPISLEFCMGLCLAAGLASWRGERRMPGGVMAVLAALGFLAMLLAPRFVPHAGTGGLFGPSRVLAWGVPAVVVVVAFIAWEPGRGRAVRAAIALGDASYALYLAHVFVMITYARLLKGSVLGAADQRFVVPVVVAVSIALGLAVHRVLERPLLARLHVLMRRPARAAPASLGGALRVE